MIQSPQGCMTKIFAQWALLGYSHESIQEASDRPLLLSFSAFSAFFVV